MREFRCRVHVTFAAYYEMFLNTTATSMIRKRSFTDQVSVETSSLARLLQTTDLNIGGKSSLINYIFKLDLGAVGGCRCQRIAHYLLPADAASSIESIRIRCHFQFDGQ